MELLRKRLSIKTKPMIAFAYLAMVIMIMVITANPF